MGWIIAIIVGGISGWLASMVMNRDASMGIFWNVVVGVIGSSIGNWVGGWFGISGTIQQFSITGLAVSFVGAVILLGIVNLVQRGKVR
ncbi:MAG: GlsB/YeaQ/YmgE family stress response membrane protein [Pseudomonadota bacterium]